MEIDELIRWALRLSRPDPVPAKTVALRTGRSEAEVLEWLPRVAEPVERYEVVVGWRERPDAGVEGAEK